MAESASQAPAKKIGAYLLQKRLASPLPAVVWSAVHEPSGARVVLYQPPPKLAAQPAYLSRFRQAGLVARAVRHAGLAPVRGIEEIGGKPVLVAEAVEGKPLSLVLKAGKVPHAKVPAVVRQLLTALDAAHQKNALHGSVVPEAIVVAAKGRLVVTGLGLPRPTARERKEAGLEEAIVTPYSSPEEMRGELLSKRSDYYAVGAIAYHMLLGTPPYDPSSPQRMRGLIGGAQEPVKLRTADPGIPIPLVRAVGKLMSKSSKDRYLKAEAALQELGFSAPEAPAAPVEEVIVGSEAYEGEEPLEEEPEGELEEVAQGRGMPGWMIGAIAAGVAVVGLLVMFVIKTVMVSGAPSKDPAVSSGSPTATTSAGGGGEQLTAGTSTGATAAVPTLEEARAVRERAEIRKARKLAAAHAAAGAYQKAFDAYGAEILRLRAVGVEGILGQEIFELQQAQMLANRTSNVAGLVQAAVDAEGPKGELEALRQLAQGLPDEESRTAWMRVLDGMVASLATVPLKRAYEELSTAWKSGRLPTAEVCRRHYATLAAAPESEWCKKAEAEGKPVYQEWVAQLKERIALLEAKPAATLLAQIQTAFGPAPWASDLPALAAEVKKLSEEP